MYLFPRVWAPPPRLTARFGLIRLREQLAVDTWLIGRITGQEYAKRDAYPPQADQSYRRKLCDDN
jgi:hypothetical protein